MEGLYSTLRSPPGNRLRGLFRTSPCGLSLPKKIGVIRFTSFISPANLTIHTWKPGLSPQDKPLSLTASLCFEQSYSGVDGDSASSTEVYALLSSLTGLPLRQDIAVTGSVNQNGEIQPIGGVNQKVEGFFDVCQAAGLSGSQGVMIPHQNVDHLMLRPDVVEAVEAGKFHIYPVETIDQGVEILMGRPAGEKQADGTFPEGTVNRLVDEKLAEMARRMKEFEGGGGE